MRVVARAVVASRRNAWGEFVVRAYDQEGKHWSEADYYTDDRADAEATAAAMVTTLSD